MRILPAFLLLTACSPEAPELAEERTLYAGQGRDRLCIAGDRVGFITYGSGDTNCSMQGRISQAGEHLFTIRPLGDADCRIDLIKDSGSVRLGKMASACAYYCGPGADYAGKAFAKSGTASPAVDFAGDPLC